MPKHSWRFRALVGAASLFVGGLLLWWGRATLGSGGTAVPSVAPPAAERPAADPDTGSAGNRGSPTHPTATSPAGSAAPSPASGAPEEAAATGRLLVRVLEQGAGGQPVPGAEVVLSTRDAFDRAGGVTNGAGRVRVAEVPEGLALVTARHPDFGAGLAVAWVGPEGASTEVVLGPAARLEGEVMDPDGAPVAEAWVQAGGVATTSDRFGRFVLEGLPERVTYPRGAQRAELLGALGLDPEAVRGASLPDDRQGPVPPLPVKVEAQGFSPWLGAGMQGEPLEVTLHPLWTLRGRVLQAGRPAAGARVDLRGAPRHETSVAVGLRGPIRHRETRTDAQGRFAFEGLIDAAVTVEATQGDLHSKPVSHLGGLGDREIVLELVGKARLRVRVRHAGTGRPLAGATVKVSSGLVPGSGARTGDDGRATLELVKSRHTLTVVKPGFVTKLVPLRWEEGDDETLDLELAPGLPLTVQVERASGARVFLAYVKITDTLFEQDFTDEAGRARFFLAPGRHTIWVRAAGGVEMERQVVLPRAEPLVVRLPEE